MVGGWVGGAGALELSHLPQTRPTHLMQSHSLPARPWAATKQIRLQWAGVPEDHTPLPTFSPGPLPLLTWLPPAPCLLLKGPGARGGAMGAGPVELVPGRSATILPAGRRHT